MKEALFEVIDRLGGELTALSDDIFDHPEVGYEEYRASGLLCDLLEREGFAVERGIAGIPTAFRAVYENGVGGPSMGLLCEYDALEGIGHACGHHTQGPCTVGAALAVKETVKDQPYRLVIYGTPAEETVGGKIQMKERGCFQDIDVALMMHPSPTTTTDVKCMAMATYQVTFHGISAHAAMSPESGRSALDAVMLAAHGIECLREHVKEDTRLHYTIKDAGGPSNVVPATAKAEFCMRSYNTDYLYGVMERVKKIIRCGHDDGNAVRDRRGSIFYGQDSRSHPEPDSHGKCRAGGSPHDPAAQGENRLHGLWQRDVRRTRLLHPHGLRARGHQLPFQGISGSGQEPDGPPQRAPGR